MKLKYCTPEFQKIYWKNKIIKRDARKDIESLIKERNKMNLEKKTEVDFILEDLFSSKIITGINENQRNKLDEYYNKVSKNKQSKKNILKLLDGGNALDTINKELKTFTPAQRKKTDETEVNEIIIQDIMRSPTRVKTIKTIKTVKFEKFISTPITRESKLNKFEDIHHTQISTQIQTETNENPSPNKIRESKIFKANNIVNELDRYEKLMKKVKEQALSKVEEYDRKRIYLKNKYKMVCEAFFPNNL